MRHHPWLVQRWTKLYIRRAVPTDLLTFVAPKREIWRSLHTGEDGQALKRFRRASAELDAWFDEQRRRLHQGLAADEPLHRAAVRTVREEDLRAARWDTLSVCQEEASGGRARPVRSGQRCPGGGKSIGSSTSSWRGPGPDGPSHGRYHQDRAPGARGAGTRARRRLGPPGGARTSRR